MPTIPEQPERNPRAVVSPFAAPDGTIPIDAASWQDGLLKEGSYGTVKSCSYNATYALSHAPEWRGVLGYDLNSSELSLRLPIPGTSYPSPLYPSMPCPWQDFHAVLASNWLQSQSIGVGKDIAFDAANIVSRQHPFHPIRDYLTSLEWDQEPRLDYWLTSHLGADPSSYTEAISSRFLISAVARALKPGCKVDTCLILEGKQGKLKSTALSILTVNPAWFTDEIPSLLTKDADIQLRGMWIVELGELDAIKGVGWSKIKSWLSRRTDRYRPVNGKAAVDFPRQTVFSASVNHFQYLDDETGARRFWPVGIGQIDLDALHADRDQLWAEATHRYLSGLPWWLDKADLVKLAATEQSARYEPDVWEERVSNYAIGRDYIKLADLATWLGFKMPDCGRPEQMRLGKCLHSLGWERKREGSGERSYYYVKSKASV